VLENALVIRLRPELMKYTPQQVDALVRRVYQRLGTAPDVDSLAYMQGGEGLVWNWQNGNDAQVSLSAETPDRNAGLQVLKQDVSSGFFSALRIPLIEGRGVTEQDVAGSPTVAVINHALAQSLWPGGGYPVGGTFYIDSKPFQMIGVCADLQPANPLYPPESHVYLAYWQSNSTCEGDVRFVLRVREDPAEVLPRVRRAIQSIDARVPIGEDMPLAVQVRLEYMPVLLAQRVMTFCGFLALCLSAMGLYSVLAFAVRARSLEIGVRMALGARKQDVLRLFLWEGARLALFGAAAGVLAALVSTRLLRSLLYGVEATDPGIIMGAVGLLVVVALAACVLPASRAASISPMRVLRSE
jgi:predicted permease